MGAFPSTTTPVSIVLFRGVPFDNNYKHHSFIFPFRYNGGVPSHTRNQRNFLYRKKSSGGSNVDIYPHDTLTDVYNFDFKNGLNASVYLALTPQQRLSNYMEVISGEQHWYYFITDITQSNNDVYKLELECDVFMTYGNAFMVAMSGKPVYTQRKHCNRYANNGFTFSWDYKNGDSTYSGLKPSILKEKKDATFIITGASDTQSISALNNVMWLYIVRDKFKDYRHDGTTHYFDTYNYTLKNIKHDYVILCVPLGVDTLILRSSNSQEVRIENIKQFVSKLVSDGRYKSAKISPYPPFNTFSGTIRYEYGSSSYDGGNYILTLTSSNTTQIRISTYADNNETWCYFGNNVFLTNENTISHYTDSSYENDKYDMIHSLVIVSQFDCDFNYDDVWLDNFQKEGTETILSNKVEDTKLLFSPFRKYVMTSAYGEENEVYMELLTSLSPFTTYDTSALHLSTITTLYGGDYTYFTYIKPVLLKNSIYGFANYKNAKIGLNSTNNYTIPVGTDALDVWKSTQSETYYASKNASAISSGLQIATGVGMVAGGIVMTATGGASPMGIGMIGAGVSTMSSGIANEVALEKAKVAKIEDLGNTPNTINVSGSSYAHDMVMQLNNFHPYFLIYECTPNIKYSANNFFYKYGYEVGRDCYFNLNISADKESETSQNALFTRTIFNYIQISEDITNKIDNSEIPFIIKQKFSQIFNNGITLWTFMGFSSLETLGGVETSTYSLDKWLFKINLENKEYKGETF